jgi:hypothetical protein
MMKNGKLAPDEMLENFTVVTNQNKVDKTNKTAVDNLTEYDSLEQDGVLVVNVSTDNILNLDELYLNIQIANITNKMEDVTNKIQSNSREITGDSKNIQVKDIPDNITVAPAPTNGVLPTNEQEDDSVNMNKLVINNTVQEVASNVEANDLFKPTESLQSLIEDTGNRRRRRRRHGNRRRFVSNN